jgi:hypothetical protein
MQMAFMSITTQDIRNVINIPDTSELGDAVIISAITRATTLIDSRYEGTTALMDLAKLNYAAYLAYLSYSDRVLNEHPGSYNAEGIWTPIGEAIVRYTRDKLAALKDAYEKAIEGLTDFTSPAIHPMPSVEPLEENYPARLELSDQSSAWGD